MNGNARREDTMELKTLENTPSWEWPESAGGTLLRILRSDQVEESDRLLAVELAGDFVVINDELVDALLSILCNGDESDELRGRAAISLGPALEHSDIEGFEDPDDVLISKQTFRRIQKTLPSLYVDAGVPKAVRRRILEASVRAPQDWHLNAVRAAYSSGDDDWRLTAVFCMEYVRGFDDQILESLNSKNPDVHYHAVCAAGNWQIDAAWPHIAALLTSRKTDKPLLIAAVEAAANIRPRKALDILHNLMHSKDKDIAEAVALAMALADEPCDEEDDEDDESFR